MTRFALLGADAAERGLLRIDFLTLGMFVFHKYQGQRFLYSKLIPIVEFSTIHHRIVESSIDYNHRISSYLKS